LTKCWEIPLSERKNQEREEGEFWAINNYKFLKLQRGKLFAKQKGNKIAWWTADRRLDRLERRKRVSLESNQQVKDLPLKHRFDPVGGKSFWQRYLDGRNPIDAEGV